MAGRGEPAALDRREMAAHAVDLADARAAAQQLARERLLVCERERRQRQGQQRRSAAREQAEHEVVARQSLHQLQHALRGREPRFIRHRMRGLDHFDAPHVVAVAVARDHQAFERPLPVRFDGGGHRRRCLAGADHDGAAARSLGQVLRQHRRRLRRRDRRREHAAQQLLHAFWPISKFASFSSARTIAE
jgi:hypothetical protein